jgi:hypothetical protein
MKCPFCEEFCGNEWCAYNEKTEPVQVMIPHGWDTTRSFEEDVEAYRKNKMLWIGLDYSKYLSVRFKL